MTLIATLKEKSNLQNDLEVTGDGVLVDQATLLAGERNPGTSNDYIAAVSETTGTVVDVATNETDVSSTAPALLFGLYVNTTLSAHDLPIKDGTGGSTIVTIPASAAAGSMYDFPGIKFNTALIVDPDDAATGNITVAWRPQG